MHFDRNEEAETIVARVKSRIDILMKKSYWAKDQNATSLTQALQEELDEFIRSFLLGDRVNVYQEAADTVMIILCALHYMAPGDANHSLDMVLSSIADKLERRFSHLYKEPGPEQMPLFAEQLPDPAKLRTLEDNIWERSKKIETLGKYAFCNNPQCASYLKLGTGNILCTSARQMKCTVCGVTSSITDSSLFAGMQTDRNTIVEVLAQEFRNMSAQEVLLLRSDDEKKDRLLSWLSSILPREKVFIDLMERRFDMSPLETESKILALLKLPKFEIKQTVRKRITFNARSWNNQLAVKHILRTTKNLILEAMLLFHYADDNLKDVTVEISNMYGCPVGCIFCASGNIKPNKLLSAADYVAQVNSCLAADDLNPEEFNNFFVSFAGIGEPSLAAEEIAKAARWLRRLHPHVRFNIPTFGVRIQCFDIWKSADMPIRTLQIPYYHHEKAMFNKLVPNIAAYSIQSVLTKAVELKKATPGCRVKVNFIVLSHINDSDEDLSSFCSLFAPFRDDITVKISFLNPTDLSEKMRFESPSKDRLLEISHRLSSEGFANYIFGTEVDCTLGCGQTIANYKAAIDDFIC